MTRGRRAGHAAGCWLTLAICGVLLLASCHSGSMDAAARIDARTVLASRLTHGLGDDILDSPLVADSTNAALLVALRSGMDGNAFTERLRGIPDGSHRVELLIDAGLLARDSSGVHTTFPIVIGSDRVWYDSLTRAAARQTLELHHAGFKAILAEVDRRGWHDWGYHFVWSEILDSQRLWADVSDAGLGPPLVPAITWVIHPAHPYKSGTNYYPGRIDPPAYLATTWTPAVGSQLPLVETAAEDFLSWLAAKPATDSLHAAARSVGLLSDSLKPTIPVIRAGDPLLAELRDASREHMTTLRNAIDSDLLARRLHCPRRVAWVMAYHDVSWSVLQSLVERGLVKPFGAGTSERVGRIPAGVTALVPTDSAFTRVLRAAAGDLH